MKKILSICLAISFLCACGGMRGLQRQSTQNLHKTVNEEGGLYYNSEKGHNSKVKMIVTDDGHAQIKIPVSYTVETKNLDKIRTIPSLTSEDIAALQNEVGECHNCVLDTEHITAKELLTTYLNKDYLTICIVPKFRGQSAEVSVPIIISEPTRTLQLADMGIVHSSFEIIPQHMKVSCNRKACAIVDEDGKYVNKIFISRSIVANEKRINELIVQEKKAEAKRKAEEAKRKAEEAKRKAEEAKKKAEEARKWRQTQRLQKKECPGLYRTLYWAQQTGYIDPIVGMKTAKRFQELDCGWWLQQQMNQAMY